VVRFIAEIGSNHNRDRERCVELVDAAAAAGCRAAKLQVFRLEDLFAPEALAHDPRLTTRRAWEFPLELLDSVRERCDARGIELGATPFGLWAVDALVDHVDFFKIASYELLWHELIRACAATGKPLILSTGMGTLEEVAGAFEAARGTQVRLLHCVSGYPTPPEQANLAAIAALHARFGVPVGWSDHSCCERVVHRAVAHWRASDVEVHLDIDGEGYEAGEHCWTPNRLRAMIASLNSASHNAGNRRERPDDSMNELGVRDVAPADEHILDGNGIKRPMPVELPDVAWRADPDDGLRPLRSLRAQLAATSSPSADQTAV
jgi:sialic acid synthase SpsE